MKGQPHIVLVTTGGTIACKYVGSGGSGDGKTLVPIVSGYELLSNIGIEGLKVSVHSFDSVSGWNMDPKRQYKCSCLIQSLCSKEDVSGVVVTHGTDTVEETALLVHTFHSNAKPVVFVAAMRNGDSISPDGPQNLHEALLVAMHADALDRGVMLVMNGDIHSIPHVSKVDASNMGGAFKSSCGTIGRVSSALGVQFFPHMGGVHSLYRGIGTCGDGEFVTAVPLIKVFTGMQENLMEYFLRDAVGIVVEGTGSGNVPDSVASVLAKAAGRIPVVLVSRCPTGRLDPAYGSPGGGASLREAGVIMGMGLNAQKARILLMVALSWPLDDEKTRLQRMRKFFENATL